MAVKINAPNITHPIGFETKKAPAADVAEAFDHQTTREDRNWFEYLSSRY